MERIQANSTLVKRLGHWTTAREIEVRARRGAAVLDLRSYQIPVGDIELRLTLDRAMVKLLVPDGTTIDTWDLHWTGGGKVEDWTGLPNEGGRRVRVTGSVRDSEIRVHRGGFAVLSALFSHTFVDDCIRAHRTGTMPTVLDPSRA
jgi:hypothetical protein